MAARLHVRVVSPEAVVFEGDATSVVIPAWDGKVGILPGHAPLIALLGEGEMVVDLPGGGAESLYLQRGAVRVEGDRVTVLSESASLDVPEDLQGVSVWVDLEESEEEVSGAPS